MFHVKHFIIQQIFKDQLWRPQVESNHYLGLRSPLFYPLNYEDKSRKILIFNFFSMQSQNINIEKYKIKN